MELPQQKEKRGHEIALFFFALALFATIISLFFVHRTFSKRLALREKQVQSLITELGSVRDENLIVSKRVKQNDVNFEALARMVVDVSQKYHQAADAQKIPAVKSFVSPPQNDSAILTHDPFLDILLVGHHAMLTDTIMLARVRTDLQKIFLISIPRDLFIGGRKINEYYNFFGIYELMKQVETITGVTVDQYAVLNMEAFQKIIDAVSGIDVVVEKDIVDGYYPRPDGTNETYTIAKGAHHMDGSEALKFVRSRKTTSDFDRAKRQQQVIAALKEKILSLKFLDDFGKAKKFYDGISGLVETNIGFLEALQYLSAFQDYTVMHGGVLSTANYLYSTKSVSGQYILLPKIQDYSEVHEHIQALSVQ